MPISSRAAAGAIAATGLALATMSTASARTPVEPEPAAGTPGVALVAQLPTGSALDASPDPQGRTIYFTSSGRRGPAIYAVAAAGGPKRVVLDGAPLRGPRGIAVSNDAKRLYVADTKAGHVLVVPVRRGGRPHVLAGTAGSAPRGLEIQTRGGRDFVVYSGRARDGKPAVLRIRTTGALRPSVVLKGAPLSSPDGVAISRAGAIYVTDHGSGGRVLRIDGTSVSTVASGVRLGNPGGIALTLDESKILISSLSAAGSAQVLIVDAVSGATSTFDDVIGANQSAGGLHRARAAVPMGWADVQRPGRVYRVDP